jgi:hypothetical protein
MVETATDTAMRKRAPLTRDEAEAIGIAALGYVVADSVQLSRFLGLTGLTPDVLRAEAGEPHMLAAVLDHLAGNESDLVACAANCGYQPETMIEAAEILHGRGGGRR